MVHKINHLSIRNSAANYVESALSRNIKCFIHDFMDSLVMFAISNMFYGKVPRFQFVVAMLRQDNTVAARTHGKWLDQLLDPEG